MKNLIKEGLTLLFISLAPVLAKAQICGDTSGNISDKIAPKISFTNGRTAIELKVGSSYSHDNVTVTDNIDKPLDIAIRVIKSDLNTTKVGTYFILYEAKDRAGNIVRAQRAIRVIK